MASCLKIRIVMRRRSRDETAEHPCRAKNSSQRQATGNLWTLFLKVVQFTSIPVTPDRWCADLHHRASMIDGNFSTENDAIMGTSLATPLQALTSDLRQRIRWLLPLSFSVQVAWLLEKRRFCTMRRSSWSSNTGPTWTSFSPYWKTRGAEGLRQHGP